MSGSMWNPGDAVLVWAVNVIVQVTLISAAALLIGSRLRRSSAARHTLYCLTLWLLLFCPAVVWLVQSTGTSLVSISILQQETVRPDPAIDISSDGSDTPTEMPPSASLRGDVPRKSQNTPPTDGVPSQSDSAQRAQLNGINPLHLSGVAPGAESPNELESPSSPAASLLVPKRPRSSRNAIVDRHIARTVGQWLLLIWGAGTLFLLVRLMIAWQRLANILRRATPNSDPLLAESFDQIWQGLQGTHDGRRVPQLVFSDQFAGPVAAGFRAPKVVLPQSLAGKITGDQLHDILVHEVAHLVRGDQLVVLMQNIVAAIFWVHPLVRELNLGLAQAREEVCDNHVLASSDAPTYCRTLLTVTQLMDAPQTVSGAVGLFTFKWKLEQRVAGLLDERRNCVTRVSTKGWSLIGITTLALSVTAALGTISIASDTPEASAGQATPGLPTVSTPIGVVAAAENDVTKDVAAEVEAVDNTVDQPDPKETIAVRGVVLRPDGSPAVGATVRAALSMYADAKALLSPGFQTPMAVAKTDSDGHFRIDIYRHPFGDLDLSTTRYKNHWKETRIAASLEGFGCQWVVYREIEGLESIDLKLVQDVPIRGKILDLEGQPVPGVSVKARNISASNTGDLSAWLDAVRAGETPHTSFRHTPRYTNLRVAGIEATRTTDENGDFEIRGLGRERATRLQIVGDSVAFQTIRVVTREMNMETMSVFRDSTVQVHGASFVLPMSPSQVVEGVVIDAETRTPLPGVRVEGTRFAGTNLTGRKEIVTTSDSQGRFRLVGLPKAQPTAKPSHRHSYLMLRPNDDQPYLMRRVQVPAADGLEPIKVTAKLHRGIWIQGRVTDKSTGQPVKGVRLHYIPYRTNVFAQALPEFDDDGNVQGDQTRYRTDRDGRYRLVGLPGRAVIGAESIASPYRYGVGYEQLRVPDERGAAFGMFYRNPVPPGPKWPNSVAVIDPDADTKSVDLDLELDPGASVKIRVLDQHNEQVDGADVHGLDARFRASRTTGDRDLVAISLTASENRAIVVHHSARHIGRVARIKPVNIESGRIQIQLQPCIRITGTLTDDGNPMSGLRITPRILPHGDFGASLPAFTTDTKGRFEGTLLPGTQYSLYAEGNGLDLVATVAEELDVDPGRDIDLGVLTLSSRREFIPKDSPAK